MRYGPPSGAGVETVADAVALAGQIKQHAGPEKFAGFLLYNPEDAVERTQAFLDEALTGVRAGWGSMPEIISTGGTPNLANLGKIRGATEHRAGTYIFNDRMMLACGAAQLEDCRPACLCHGGQPRGRRARHPRFRFQDTHLRYRGGLDGHGLIREYPRARIAQFLGRARLSQPLRLPEEAESRRGRARHPQPCLPSWSTWSIS